MIKNTISNTNKNQINTRQAKSSHGADQGLDMGPTLGSLALTDLLYSY